MKLLFEFPRFHTNNAGMVNALIDDGHEVVFSVVRQSDIEDHSRIKPVRQMQSLASKVLCHLFQQNDAVLPLYFPNIHSHFRFLRNCQLDIAVIRSPYRVICIFTLIYCLIYRKKVLFYSQYLVIRKNNLPKWLFRYFLSVLCNANWMCPLYFKTFDFQKHIPFLVEDNSRKNNRMRENISEGLRLLVVAKSMPRKNIILVIKTLKALLERGFKGSLTIVTEVSTNAHRQHYEEIIACLDELGIAKYVEILRNVEHREMPKIYRACDIFIFPAFNEVASVSLLEAMAHGCVAITSDQNGTATYINHGNNGFVFDPNDMDSLVFIIESLTEQKKYEYIYKNSTFSSTTMTSRKVFLKNFYDAIQ